VALAEKPAEAEWGDGQQLTRCDHDVAMAERGGDGRHSDTRECAHRPFGFCWLFSQATGRRTLSLFARLFQNVQLPGMPAAPAPSSFVMLAARRIF